MTGGRRHQPLRTETGSESQEEPTRHGLFHSQLHANAIGLEHVESVVRRPVADDPSVGPGISSLRVSFTLEDKQSTASGDNDPFTIAIEGSASTLRLIIVCGG